jgi:hypothetical protein
MRRGRLRTNRIVAILILGCTRDQDSATRPDSAPAPGSSTAVAFQQDSLAGAACFAADRSVLARTPGSVGAPMSTINGWIRLDRFNGDSASAKLIDSDGFTLDAAWRRMTDSLVVAGFNDFVKIEMRLRVADSAARGTLKAHSDAALERDSAGKLREFSRSSRIAFRQAPCDSMPREAGAAEIDIVGHGTPRPGIRFDPAKVRRGSTVGELVIDSIIARQAVADTVYVGTARFRGAIELSGWTMRHPDPDAYRVVTCFEADTSSAARLPRWDGDERRAWFCFSNRAEAAQALGPPSAGVPATIVVDQFTIHRGFSDEVNSARFIRRVRQ